MPVFPDNPKPNQRFVADDQVLYRWDAQMAMWRILHANARSPALFAASGSIVDLAGNDVPAGWYLCDGSEKNRVADYPLFSVIGTMHGDGDGSTTFALPDLRGRAVAMADGDSGRMPGWDMAMAGGEARHLLIWQELPDHTHVVHDPGHTHGDYGHPHGIPDPNHGHQTPPTGSSHSGNWWGQATWGGALYYNEWSGASGTGIWYGTGYASIGGRYTGVSCGGAGSSWDHNNVQATMALNKIIKR